MSDHGGWAIFVTASADGALLDRRRVELVDDALPAIPHHHEAQMLPVDQGVALVERVRASAESYAASALDAVAATVPDIGSIALRACPELPPTIAECIADYRARNVADWVMYRRSLAKAAEARGWTVHWFEPKSLDLEARSLDLRKTIGPPWGKEYKMAMAAAIAANSILKSAR